MRLVIDVPDALAARIEAIRFPPAFAAMTLREKMVFLADSALRDYEANIYALVSDDHRTLIRQAVYGEGDLDDVPF